MGKLGNGASRITCVLIKQWSDEVRRIQNYNRDDPSLAYNLIESISSHFLLHL